MHQDALIDGIAADDSWLDERAFQFGDGLFETIAIVDGVPCLWDAHMARLSDGCRRLQLPIPDQYLLHDESLRLAAGRARAVLKIFWTAGRSERGYRRPSDVQPRRMLRVSQWNHPVRPAFWSVRLCRHRLGENPSLAGIKHLNRLDQVLARAEWDDAAFEEGLMLGQDGRVVCGTMCNLFLQAGDRLLTPCVRRAGIAGVVRGLALQIASDSGQVLEEDDVAIDAVHAADAVYLSNSLIGVVRVGRFEDKVFNLDVVEHPLMTETRRRCHRPAIRGDRC